MNDIDPTRVELSKSVGVTRGIFTDLRWWRHAAKDGNKLLFGSFLIFVSSLMILGASFFIYSSSLGEKTGLCEYTSPRKILTTVKGVEGPAVLERGQVTERAVRCVQGKDILNVLTYRNFKNLDTNQTVQDLIGEQQPRLRGSVSTDVVIQLPEKVTPGIWRLEGVDQVPDTGELRTWFSEPFFVVAK